MENNKVLIETLMVKATDYSTTSFKLVKLKALDKTTDVVSSFIPHAVVMLVVSTCVLFVNLALALWIGRYYSDAFLGFLIVAAFYALLGLILHFLLHNWFKRIVADYIIKLVLR